MPVAPVLDVKGLTVMYGGEPAVDGASFGVSEGQILGIVGPNGAGKTTMFRAILGLQQQHAGTVGLFGHGPDRREALLPLIGYVPQKASFDPRFPATVSDVVSMGLTPRKRTERAARLVRSSGCCPMWAAKSDAPPEDPVSEALQTVGLGDLRGRRIGEMSSGQVQRVFIAKALVKGPLLMILDEPVTSVDADSQAQFYAVIRDINKRLGVTIVWSSHDLDAVSEHATDVACMNSKILFHGTKGKFFSSEENLRLYAESAMQTHMHGHGM